MIKILDTLTISWQKKLYDFNDFKQLDFYEIIEKLKELDTIFNVTIIKVCDCGGVIPHNVKIMVTQDALPVIRNFGDYSNISVVAINSKNLDQLPENIKIHKLGIYDNIDLSDLNVDSIHVSSNYTLGNNKTIKSVSINASGFEENLHQHDWIEELIVTDCIFEKITYEKITKLRCTAYRSISDSVIKKILNNANIEYLLLVTLAPTTLIIDMSNNESLKEIKTINVLIEPSEALMKIKQNADKIRFKKIKPIMS